MDAYNTRNDCDTCPGRMVCHCLQITEELLLEALEAFDLRTVHEVRQHTGAGDGCTACHRQLRRFIERRAICLPVIQSASSSS
jgi:bacterioferritin-associated ferredoxin